MHKKKEFETIQLGLPGSYELCLGLRYIAYELSQLKIDFKQINCLGKWLIEIFILLFSNLLRDSIFEWYYLDFQICDYVDHKKYFKNKTTAASSRMCVLNFILNNYKLTVLY